MRKPASPPTFPEYLRQAIPKAGFATPSDFARAASISQSVVSRWLSGTIRPTVPLLERAAPHLHTLLSTLVRIAYPEIDAGLPIVDDMDRLHPQAARLNRLLTGLPEADRDILERLVDAVMDSYDRPRKRQAG